MTRHLMATRILPSHVQEYLAMHRAPDPAVGPALLAHGHADYRLHLLGGYAIASFDYLGSDLDADRARLRALPELADWMARTKACQAPLSEAPNAPVWSPLQQIYPLQGER